MDHFAINRKRNQFLEKIVKNGAQSEKSETEWILHQLKIQNPAGATLLSPQIATVEFLEFPNLLKK